MSNEQKVETKSEYAYRRAFWVALQTFFVLTILSVLGALIPAFNEVEGYRLGTWAFYFGISFALSLVFTAITFKIAETIFTVGKRQ